jgi:hypothetical protein
MTEADIERKCSVCGKTIVAKDCGIIPCECKCSRCGAGIMVIRKRNAGASRGYKAGFLKCSNGLLWPIGA